MKLESLLETLKVEYIAGLPEKVATIREHLAADNRELLRDDFHKLKGSGKTYGVPEITRLGEVTEKICAAGQEQIPKAIPLAIVVLEKIFQARQANREFAVDGDVDFKEILSLSSTQK